MSVISVSVSGDELKKFDEVITKMGFSSRSDAIREAMNRFVIQNRWLDHMDEEQPFVATIVYPARRENTVHDVLRKFDDIVVTATHTHLGERRVEWVILRGDNQTLRQFIQQVSAIKEVNLCRCTV